MAVRDAFGLTFSGATEAGFSPYSQAVRRFQGNYIFPDSISLGVQIVGSWGFSATTPDDVKQACLIQSARLFKRQDTVFGVQANAEFGAVNLTQKGLDPDACTLLQSGGYMRVTL